MSVVERARLGRATEDYIKAIFKLEENGGTVSTTAIAEALSVSPAAVTKAVRQLALKGYASHAPYRGVALTASGQQVALEMIRHHRLLEAFLHDILGYSWDEVDEEAERLEHHISEKFEAAIDRMLGYPSFDPHGAPIPERSGTLPTRSGSPLADAEVSETVVVARVHDDDPKALQFLSKLGMRVGTVVTVVDKQPFSGPLTLRIGGQDQIVGHELAGNVLVERKEAGKTTNLGT